MTVCMLELYYFCASPLPHSVQHCFLATDKQTDQLVPRSQQQPAFGVPWQVKCLASLLNHAEAAFIMLVHYGASKHHGNGAAAVQRIAMVRAV